MVSLKTGKHLRKTGTGNFCDSEADQLQLQGPVEWQGMSNQSLCRDVGRQGALERRGLDFRSQECELRAGADVGVRMALAARDVAERRSGAQGIGPAMCIGEVPDEGDVGGGLEFTGDDLDLGAPTAAGEGSRDCEKIRM